ISPCGRYMYFASKGHPGYGGNDIFVATRLGDSWTEWSTPKNMGPIINSVKDDRYYTISPDGQLAYLSSSRMGGSGMEDIYYVDLGLLQKLKDKIASISGKTDSIDFDHYNISGTVTDVNG
ncbi:MAG TPA: flagellar motor protein MotB, partial [Candidatus Cloacimonadota bacterium]|nr:flagellar motor protein MotB [Candidatus Cloacimonadota bacterium]